jgi:hypothetical protein
MRSKRLLPALVAFGLVSVLAAAPQAGRPERTKGAAPAPAKPIIRKDLLVFAGGPIAPPRRDIFRPRDSGLPAAPQTPAIKPQAKKPQASPPAEAPTFTLSIVYVGSVRSGGKISALIVREGQTTPVAEGDVIVPGYKVVRITPDEIEVEGPNSERKTFSRQGDRP